VPLYRKVITGGAVEQGAEYGGRTVETSGGVEGDETEDLYTLLLTVKVIRNCQLDHLFYTSDDPKAHHPDVQGVSVGAILSNYQRVRVEHVYVQLLDQQLTFTRDLAVVV
jgi:diphthine-ammonia ligase